MQCQHRTRLLSTSREILIRRALDNRTREIKYSYTRTFSQLLDMVSSIGRKAGLYSSDSANMNKLYSCHSNPQKARAIAKTLVSTWKQAKLVAEANGMSFLAVLQPVAYFGNANIDYLDLTAPDDIALRKQYEVVYPLIIEEARKASMDFANLVSLYDGCDDCYIDFCHVGPQAHHKLANALGEKLGL